MNVVTHVEHALGLFGDEKLFSDNLSETSDNAPDSPRINYPRKNYTPFKLHKPHEICVDLCSHMHTAFPAIPQSRLDTLPRKVPRVPHPSHPHRQGRSPERVN